MVSAHMTGALENIQESGDIRVHVCLRILQRIAYAGLSGEMHHPVGSFALIDFAERTLIDYVDGLVEKPGSPDEARKARLLQRDVVIGIEVVYADYRVAAREQLGGHM